MPSLRARIETSLAGLAPGYFAMVMATGIVSIASHLLGFDFIAGPLLWLNVVFYLVLWLLTFGRIAWYRENFMNDFQDLSRGAGYFTMIAGTCILGSQFIILLKAVKVAKLLLFLGMGLWCVLIYGVFTAFVVREGKPSLESGISGTWLVATVGTQSVSILSALLASEFPGHQDLMMFISLTLYLIGGMLYLVIITLVFYRFMFFEMRPQELSPPYWIDMGAVAITTLAGATLAGHSKETELLTLLLPFLIGFTLFFWAAATWWIPFLVVLKIWRHVIRRIKLSYTPEYWSLVFPLGMYTSCTFQLAKITGVSALVHVPRYFIYAALFAWGATFLGLVVSLIRLFRQEPQTGPHDTRRP